MKSKNRPAYLQNRVVWFMLATGLATPLMAAQGPAEVVGEVTLLIGQAQVTGVDEVVRTVEHGLAVRAGDRIETQAGGHVHVRFVDGGRLSVRPGSRLQIENYNYSAQQQVSAIKFRLDEGVIRSITGAWGEAARDRFRLNTPVAAIGIKGTDFVVKSDANATAASVYSGAIMLAPLGDCGAALGSCQNGRERLLSADMKGLMLELTRQQSVPQFVAAVDLLASAQRPAPSARTVAAVQSGIVTDATAFNAVNSDRPMVNESRAIELVEAATKNALSQSQVSQVVPAPAQPVQPAPINQLVWARYVWVKDGGFDTLSQSFAQASAAGRERVVSGTAHSLFREVSPMGTVLATVDNTVNFRLAGSSALFQRSRDNIVEAAKVDTGTLSVDFSRSSFATQLGVSSAAMGTQSVVANGSIGNDGIMRPVSANARVIGATTLDGREAGYLFEKDIAAGALRGVTLWGR